jgi:MurNAc alpha-1-phosphate uridylyltransferase
MKAMIFSAGLGTRFKPWTEKHPKALALVNGKTLLQHNIEYLQKHGITDVIVNVHHFADQVRNAIKENNGWGSKIQVSDEQDLLLDTGGGLLKAKELFTPGERFLTCNVDILTDLNIYDLLAFHEQHRPLVSFGVTKRKTSRYLLFDEMNQLCGWRNTKTGEEIIARGNDVLIQKAYSCVVVFEYDIFNHINLSGKFSLIDLYLQLAGKHAILGFDHDGGRWVDVGRTESVPVAESMFP